METEIIFVWEGRDIRLSYTPRKWQITDHIEIRSVDKQPLPITETGYRSYFFGPVEPAMTPTEVQDFVIEWLDKEAKSRHWIDHVNQSRQLSLF